MNKANTVMVAIFVALDVVVVAGLVVIPEIEHYSALADPGGAPNEHASDKARGHCPIGIFCI